MSNNSAGSIGVNNGNFVNVVNDTPKTKRMRAALELLATIPPIVQ